jgi:uncharacterized protein (TIGR03435 family)
LVWQVEELSGQLGRPVKDETGLKGQYDFALYWLSEYLLAAAGPDSGPDLIAAVQELGLEMKEKKGPVELIVIDHAEKTPIENRPGCRRRGVGFAQFAASGRLGAGVRSRAACVTS